jgi:two-component system sensor kinase FixL
VLLRAYAKSDAAIIEVEDDGPGISEAVAARLFKPLVTDKPKGTGLGLALCQLIVRAHGGSIEATRGSSGGALFRIVLPSNE